MSEGVLRISNRVWGLSTRWLAVCPWNGDEFWIQLPLLLLLVGRDQFEIGIGTGSVYVAFNVRWRWR